MIRTATHSSSDAVILRYSEGSCSPVTAARCFGVPQHDNTPRTRLTIVRPYLIAAVILYCGSADAGGTPAEMARAEWRVRDVGAGSGWMTPIEAIRAGLKLEWHVQERELWKSSCTVIDTT